MRCPDVPFASFSKDTGPFFEYGEGPIPGTPFCGYGEKEICRDHHQEAFDVVRGIAYSLKKNGLDSG